jgi:hypothetical protein
VREKKQRDFRHTARSSASTPAGRPRHGPRSDLCAIVGGLLILLGVGSTAQAAPITLEFTVSDFPPTFAGTPAPTDPVSGTIVYEAADVGSPIQSLTSIALSVGGHSFSLSEAGFITNPSSISTSSIIGGLLGTGVGGVSSFTSDFSLQYDRVGQPGPGANFVYASSSVFGIWRSTNFTSFSLTESTTSMPEPGAVTLFLLGLLMVLPLARRRRA